MKSKFFAFIDKASESLGVLFLSIMTLLVLLQIFCRYLLGHALAWPEEASRFSFMICTYFGISMAIADQKHLRMDVLYLYIPKAFGKILNFIVGILYSAFFLLCVYLSYEMLKKVHKLNQHSVAMGFPIYILWICLVVIFCICLLQTLRCLYRQYKEMGQPISEREIEQTEMIEDLDELDEEISNETKQER